MVFLKPPSARDGIRDALNLSTNDSILSSVTVKVHCAGNRTQGFLHSQQVFHSCSPFLALPLPFVFSVVEAGS